MLTRGGYFAILNLGCGAGFVLLLTHTRPPPAVLWFSLLLFPVLAGTCVCMGNLSSDPANFLNLIVTLVINALVWGYGISWLLTLGRGNVRRAKLRRQGLCLHCQYDLRGSRHSLRCPECGRYIPVNLDAADLESCVKALAVMNSRKQSPAAAADRSSVDFKDMPDAPPRYNAQMIRIRDIVDPELREKVLAALAERRGVSVAAIPDWFELDEADFVDLLDDLRPAADAEPRDDPRM